MKILNIILAPIKKEKYIPKELVTGIDKVNEMSTWSAINPVIHSLKELRKNTWDKQRVDTIIEWLEDNFKPQSKK